MVGLKALLLAVVLVDAAAEPSKKSSTPGLGMSTKSYMSSLLTDVSSNLCEEAGEIAKIYKTLDAHCTVPLQRLMTQFSSTAHRFAVEHMAQLLARNAVAAATAKRSVQMGFKAPGLPFTPLESSISVEFDEREQQLHKATYRLLNARDAAHESMASFDDKTLHSIATFSRTCADGCTRILFHKQQLAAQIATPPEQAVESEDDKMVASMMESKAVTCGASPLTDILAGLEAEVTKARADWMEPVRVLMRLWEDSNLRYAADDGANAAVLDWAGQSPGENATTSDWEMDSARASIVQSNAMQQVQSAQADFKASLPQYWPKALALKMQTASSDVVAEVARTEEKIAASTVAIAASYADYASATAAQYAAATQRGLPLVAITATDKQHDAMGAVLATVRARHSVVEQAASVGGRWPAPRQQWSPNGLAAFSVSTARADAMAPHSAFGDFALALQHTAGMADEAAVEQRAGDPAAHGLAEINLAAAREQLHKEVANMLNGTVRAPISPDLTSVREAEQQMHREMEHESTINAAYEADLVREVPEHVSGGEVALSEKERKRVLLEDLSQLAAAQKISSDKNSLLRHQSKMIESQSRYHNLKSRFNGTLLPEE